MIADEFRDLQVARSDKAAAVVSTVGRQPRTGRARTGHVREHCREGTTRSVRLITLWDASRRVLFCTTSRRIPTAGLAQLRALRPCPASKVERAEHARR
jgi:hypothetical protein